MNHTQPYFIHIWAGLLLFPLDSYGRVAYKKTHPKLLLPQNR